MDAKRTKTWLGAAAIVAACGLAQAAAPPASGTPAPAVPAGGLDRAALLKLADSYLGALVAHDTSKVPLAGDVKVVENVTRIRPGEGLWKNASAGPTAFRILAADPVSQQVGGIVVMGAEGKPVQVGFRLKVVNGKVAEAEHLVAGVRDPGNPNLQQPRPAFAMPIPYEYADSRGRMVHIAKSYYDALDDNNGHLAPFASDCERRENGMRTAPSGGPSLPTAIPGAAPRPPGLQGMLDCATQLDSGTFQYIDRIENRRVDIADTVTGIAIGLSHFRHPMTQKKFVILNNPDRTESDMSSQRAFDMPAMHVYKIWGGQIHEIEAVGITVGYDSATGWE